MSRQHLACCNFIACLTSRRQVQVLKCNFVFFLFTVSNISRIHVKCYKINVKLQLQRSPIDFYCALFAWFVCCSFIAGKNVTAERNWVFSLRSRLRRDAIAQWDTHGNASTDPAMPSTDTINLTTPGKLDHITIWIAVQFIFRLSKSLAEVVMYTYFISFWQRNINQSCFMRIDMVLLSDMLGINETRCSNLHSAVTLVSSEVTSG